MSQTTLDNVAASSAGAQKGHPLGLFLLFFTEMWERFSYYGMRAIFALFMLKALGMSKSLESAIYGDFTGLVYLTPLIGGYVADRYWGNRRSIIIGGLLMAAGQFCLFLSASNYQNTGFATGMMFLGLALLIFGNGFFKPNISSMVGSLYPVGDSRIDGAFSIFYMGINAGALLSPLICGGLGDTGRAADFKWGFLAACIGMLVSVVAFHILKDKYIVRPDGSAIGNVPDHTTVNATTLDAPATTAPRSMWVWYALFAVLFLLFKGQFDFDYIGSFIFASCVVAPLFIVTDPALTNVERDRIWVIIIIAIFVICFWAAFEQAGNSLTFFAAEQTERNLGFATIPASFFQVINPTFIVLLAPVMVLIWDALRARKLEPASVIKQAVGMLFLAAGYLVIILAVKDMDPEQKSSVWWLVGLYFLHTIGELCLSPIGLSMVNRLAPVRLSSLMMGVWFLSTALANWAAGTLGQFYPEDVHKAKSASAATFMYRGEKDTASITAKADTNFAVAGLANGGTWAVKLKSDDAPKPKELGFVEQIVANFGNDPLIKAMAVEDVSKKDALISLAVQSPASAVKVPPYKMKQIISLDKLKEFKEKHGREMHYAYGFNPEGTLMYVLSEGGNIERWEINPDKPKLMGIEITDLYHFFLIFVCMAVFAGVLLLVMSRTLLKMMHGIR